MGKLSGRFPVKQERLCFLKKPNIPPTSLIRLVQAQWESAYLAWCSTLRRESRSTERGYLCRAQRMGVGWGLDQELQVNPSRANGCGMGRRGVEQEVGGQHTTADPQQAEGRGVWGWRRVCKRQIHRLGQSWRADTRSELSLSIFF